MEIIQRIINDAKATEAEAVSDEEDAQEAEVEVVETKEPKGGQYVRVGVAFHL